MHYLLFYEVVDNYAEERTPFREWTTVVGKDAEVALPPGV
jgi:hypothetical protein